MTNLLLKLNTGIKTPKLTVGLNGYSKESGFTEQNFVDLHQSLSKRHESATLMEIDVAKKQFVPVEEGHHRVVLDEKPLVPGKSYKLPPADSHLVVDQQVNLRIALEPPEAFDDKTTRYELIPDENFASGDKALLGLVGKYHEDTSALTALSGFAGYLFHLAAVDVPDQAPELRAPEPDADKKTVDLLASMGRISKAEVKNRLQQRIDDFPGDEADKDTLVKARYWVTETLQDKDESSRK